MPKEKSESLRKVCRSYAIGPQCREWGRGNAFHALTTRLPRVGLPCFWGPESSEEQDSLRQSQLDGRQLDQIEALLPRRRRALESSCATQFPIVEVEQLLRDAVCSQRREVDRQERLGWLSELGAAGGGNDPGRLGHREDPRAQFHFYPAQQHPYWIE